MEEVIVIGVPVEVAHIWYTKDLWLEAFWLSLQGLLETMEEALPDSEQHEDFFEDQEPVGCHSSVNVRGKYAVSRAGFATPGHVYVVYYPNGDWQSWHVIYNGILGITVQENGVCVAG